MSIDCQDELVEVSGGRLDTIWWKGRQWAVTEYGIECLDGKYAIDKSRLLKDYPKYVWPQHMREKDWVDLHDFTTAWLVALLLHEGSIAARAARADLLRWAIS